MIYEQLHAQNPSALFLGEGFVAALNFLKKEDFKSYELDKKYLIGDFGDRLFFIMSEFETRSKTLCTWEQHRDYIDIHYILSGRERIGVCFDSPLNVVKQAYTKDIEATLYSDVVNDNDLLVAEGEYAVFFPTDIHRPGGSVEESRMVKKVVIKVAMDFLQLKPNV